MSAKPPALPSPRRRRIRPGYIVLGIALSPFLFLLAWHVSFRIRTQSEIKQLEAKARANGEPWTLAEVAATYYGPIPDEENAAIPLMDLWQAEDPGFWTAFREGHKERPGRREKNYPDGLPVFDKSWQPAAGSLRTSEADAEIMARFIEEKADHLRKLHSAVKLPRARFPIRIEEGFDALLPQLGRLKEESQLLRLEALYWISKHDTGRAVAALESNLRLAALLQEDPVLIGQLVRNACLRIGIESLSDLIDSGRLDESQTANLFLLFRSAAYPEGMRRSMVTERASAQDLFNDPVKAFSFGDESGKRGGLLDGNTVAGRLVQVTGVAAADRAFYLAKIDRMLSNHDRHGDERITFFEAELEGLWEEIWQFPPNTISGILLPGLLKAQVRQTLLDANLRCAQVSLLIERFRLQNGGAPPDSLAQLVPEFLETVPIDPFDGQALRYRRFEVGYSVYSVGRDRVDDGGRKKRPAGSRGEKDEEQTFDESFVVER